MQALILIRPFLNWIIVSMMLIGLVLLHLFGKTTDYSWLERYYKSFKRKGHRSTCDEQDRHQKLRHLGAGAAD